jgi:hypothetical protein
VDRYAYPQASLNICLHPRPCLHPLEQGLAPDWRGPTGCVSDDLRRRALELTDLFDATVEIRAVEPDETGGTDNRKRGNDG